MAHSAKRHSAKRRSAKRHSAKWPRLVMLTSRWWLCYVCKYSTTSKNVQICVHPIQKLRHPLIKWGALFTPSVGHFAECRFAERRFAECRFAEWVVSPNWTILWILSFFFQQEQLFYFIKILVTSFLGFNLWMKSISLIFQFILLFIIYWYELIQSE